MTAHFTRRRLRLPVLTLALALGATTLVAQTGAAFYTEGRVPARSTVSWEPWAPDGYNRLLVRGDGDTDLDCYVYDRFGRLVGVDNDSTDFCVIEFRNPGSGRVLIRLRNLGPVYNDYRLSLD